MKDKGYPPELVDEASRVAAMPDEIIDYSDIPLVRDFAGFERGLYKPRKERLTIRIDADVLLWFRSKGPGYQTRMNRVLREYVASKM